MSIFCVREQFLRRGHGGTAAFRRLIARPLLKDIRLQDVVYAKQYPHHCTDSHSAASRARTSKLSDLGPQDKILEKKDLQSVRQGRCVLNDDELTFLIIVFYIICFFLHTQAYCP